MDKSILLVVASEGFQQQEYEETKKVLEAAGMSVEIASDKAGVAVSHTGQEIAVTTVLDAVHALAYAGVFFIGGPGALNHLDTQESNRILNEAMIGQIPYGAICIAPRILAKAHVLVGKHATGWDGDGQLAQIFAENNVLYRQEPVVVDENCISANGPAAAEAFGEAIVAAV